MTRRYRKPIDDNERDVKDVDRARKRTLDRAVRLLAAKPRSTGELRRRLLEKPWTDHEIVEAVLAKLIEYGYLDDAQYALDLAAAKLREKPQGRYRLARVFADKDVGAETVRAAIDAAYSQFSEASALDLAIEKRIRVRGKPANPKQRKSMVDHLLRLGFSYSLIRDRIDAMLEMPDYGTD